MKLSDYVAQFLANRGLRHVFAITGGASVHLIDSLAKTPGIQYICPQHEQAGAMAADAYSRVTGGLGAAIATSGPGATNMITGIACSYFDSVPVLYITGQVTTFRLKRDTGVRQMGFQETEIVDMCKPITKYAVMVEDPRRIRYELEKACWIASRGRPGPVLVDIPDDLQRGEIDETALEPFAPPDIPPAAPSSAEVEHCLRLIGEAERPVVILGWGIELARARRDAMAFVQALNAPVLPTWPMLDMFPADHPLLVGPFGTHGARYANFAVQNADLVLAVGARLDTREAGSPYSAFARAAKKVVVDIDAAELCKFTTFEMDVDLSICADAGEFLRAVMPRLQEQPRQRPAAWWDQIRRWQARYPICAPNYTLEQDVNPYVFVQALAEVCKPGDTLTVDTGCALAWTCQAFNFKEGQRLFHAFNTTAMGYGLPAAMAASLAKDGGPVICLVGDGGIQMNIQELATIVRHNLPVKIFLINNHGYSMVQQTQEQWLEGRYEATTVEGGLAFPDFVKVAEAYGLRTVTIDSNAGIPAGLREVFATPGPAFCNVEIRPEHRVIPQVRFGRPIEDPEPFLERSEFLENMLVTPLPASLTAEPAGR